MKRKIELVCWILFTLCSGICFFINFMSKPPVDDTHRFTLYMIGAATVSLLYPGTMFILGLRNSYLYDKLNKLAEEKGETENAKSAQISKPSVSGYTIPDMKTLVSALISDKKLTEEEKEFLLEYIFEKEEDSENNLTYYLIPDETYGPCTIGFFRQRIVIPESFPLHPDFVMVYKHEGAHLKNHDNLVKLLCLLVLCVHWMNPVAYLLLLLYIDTAEIVSDSAAVEGCSKEKRKDYAKLLVLEASTSDIRPVVWKNNLSGHKKDKEGKDFKTIKRRINYMMKEKRKGLLQRGIMMAVSALTIVVSAGTVLAYQPMPSSDESFSDVIVDDSLDAFGSNCIGYDIVDTLDFTKSDCIFVDLNGNQENYTTSIEPYALCTHSMVDGTFFTHAKNSSGGCTVKVYTCQRCKKCGYLANKKYSHTITSTKCTHNY